MLNFPQHFRCACCKWSSTHGSQKAKLKGQLKQYKKNGEILDVLGEARLSKLFYNMNMYEVWAIPSVKEPHLSESWGKMRNFENTSQKILIWPPKVFRIGIDLDGEECNSWHIVK